MLLTVCIEAGRQTLTHTSWTGLILGSRKWMSGQAAALAARNDRWLWLNLNAVFTLRELPLPSERRPPSPLDFYLSWMSPHFPCPRTSPTQIYSDERTISPPERTCFYLSLGMILKTQPHPNAPPTLAVP
jgi:hypothetical protein